MKAEHRKELETNALADRMGRFLETAKQKPQRGFVFLIVAGVAAAVVVLVAIRWYAQGKSEHSDAWVLSYLYFDVFKERESAKEVSRIVRDTHEDKAQGRFLRFQENWRLLWERGILMLAADPRGAREALRLASLEYDQLKEECEGDPVLVPEALYGQAVIEETLALEDGKHLDSAIELYQDLSKKHPTSAYGRLAEKRLETLTNDEKRLEISGVYRDLQNVIRFDRFDPKMDLFHPKLK
jgi:hypothetical protein